MASGRARVAFAVAWCGGDVIHAAWAGAIGGVIQATLHSRVAALARKESQRLGAERRVRAAGGDDDAASAGQVLDSGSRRRRSSARDRRVGEHGVAAGACARYSPGQPRPLPSSSEPHPGPQLEPVTGEVVGLGAGGVAVGAVVGADHQPLDAVGDAPPERPPQRTGSSRCVGGSRTCAPRRRSPEAAVRAATTQIAARMPKASASDPGEQGADGEPAVAPEPVDARPRGPARRGGRRRRSRRAGSGRPCAVPAPSSTAATAHTANASPAATRRERGGLQQHAGGDERFAARPVGQRAGDQLPERPTPRGRARRARRSGRRTGRRRRTAPGTGPRRGRR